MGLLSELLNIQSHASDYTEMHSFILSRLKAIPDVKISHGDSGNIYVVKGSAKTYPTFVCHTDTFFQPIAGFWAKRFKLDGGNVWMGGYHDEKGVAHPQGIGGDGKCGMYICLRLLEKIENMKCVFFVESKKGLAGAGKCSIEFFKDSKWVIQCDRKHNSDIITSMDGRALSTTKFDWAIEKFGKCYGYTMSKSGPKSEIFRLKVDYKLGVCAANISSGFYLPSNAEEMIVEGHLNSAFCFAKTLAEKMTEVYEHTVPNTNLAVTAKCKSCAGNLHQTNGVYGVCFLCIKDMKEHRARCFNHGTLLVTDKEVATGECPQCATVAKLHTIH